MKSGFSHSIIIYTDGSSLGNPGPGGYGCVIVLLEKETVDADEVAEVLKGAKLPASAALY